MSSLYRASIEWLAVSLLSVNASAALVQCGEHMLECVMLVLLL